MKTLMPINKKGVLGLDTAKAFILAILTIAVIAFAVIIALSELDDTNVLTSGSKEANDTTNVLNNVTTGVADFFSNAPTWFSLLAITIIIIIIGLVIIVVNRFGKGSGGL